MGVVGGKAPTQKSGAQDKMLSDGEVKKLEKAGYNVHDLKLKKKTGGIDLYKKPNGEIVIKPKGGLGDGEPICMVPWCSGSKFSQLPSREILWKIYQEQAPVRRR